MVATSSVRQPSGPADAAAGDAAVRPSPEPQPQADSYVEVIVIGPLEITPAEHLARANGQALTLSMRELGLLTELGRRADHIVSREDLFELVWQRPMRSGDRSVDVYIRKLRVKLEVAMPDWSFIHTHFGFGYRLAASPRV
jgi:DNA-binding response OmpR family regulator